MTLARAARDMKAGGFMNAWPEFRDKKILLVGAGGFGEALAGAYLDAAAEVLVADVDEARLAALRDAHAARPLRTVTADISTARGCEQLAGTALSELGRIDVFVHAAAINHRTSVEEISDGEWERTLAINASSCFWLGRRVGASMRAAGGGRIVFFSSVSGLLAHPEHASYAASKGAMNQLLKVMAVEWAADGVGVNAVAPAYAVTPLTAEYTSRPGVMEALLAPVPMGRLAVPEDIVGPTLFLSSPRSAYITGQVLYVDGGRTLR
jgi:gluconate 5-dehydrogenase